MQLILAIDSDLRRSEQLASLVHARLRVDLVQATSAGEGLHVLQDRIPDLILTAPLLSPFDDGVLDEYLRDLGADGAHVQTLRIPVFSASPKRGLADRLFQMGRTKATSPATPDGCDPKVFADEIAVYLSRAADARQTVPQLAQALSPRQNEAPPSPVDAHPVAERPVVAKSMVMNDALIEEFTDAIDQSPAAVVEPRYLDALEPRYVEAVEPLYVDAVEPSHDMVSEPTPVEATESHYFHEARHMSPASLEMIRDAEPLTTPEANRKAPETSATFEAALAAIRAAWVKPDGTAPTSSSSATETERQSSPESPPRAQSAANKLKTQPKNTRGRETGTSGRPPAQGEFRIFDLSSTGSTK